MHLTSWFGTTQNRKIIRWEPRSLSSKGWVVEIGMSPTSGSLSTASLTYWPRVLEITSPLWFSALPSAKQEDSVNSPLEATAVKSITGFIYKIVSDSSWAPVTRDIAHSQWQQGNDWGLTEKKIHRYVDFGTKYFEIQAYKRFLKGTWKMHNTKKCMTFIVSHQN